MIVTGLGQCSWDYLALIDRYPSPDTKEEVLEWHEQGGGPVATALVALSRLGISCRFSGVIGEDEAGSKIESSLVQEGIDVRSIVRRKGAASQVAFIAVEKGTGKRTIFWKRPTGSPVQPGEIRNDFLEGSSFLLLDGLMPEVSLFAAEKAGALRIPVMLDAGRVRAGMLALARLCTYVVASAEFAKDLGIEFKPYAVQLKRKELGLRVLTITLGEQGSITAADDGEFHQPAFNVDALDSTGAGDVFHGGYVYGVVQGWDLKHTIAFASAVAALKCRAMGGRAGIPRLEEVHRFLAQQGYIFMAGK